MPKNNFRKETGKIIPNGVSLQKHENDIVVVFTEMGKDVELIPTARSRGRKTADAIIDGLEWEFKTPKGKSTQTMQHIFKKASKQSCNLVIDLRLIKIDQRSALNKLIFEFHRSKVIKRLKVITKEGQIIDIT